MFTLLFLLIARPAIGQSGSVTGIVRSAETNSPLIAVVVQLTGGDGERFGSTLTNQTGRYQISGAPAGTYEVVVTTTGFATARQTVTVAPGQAAAANFDLIPQAIDLDPVVVSASRREERALDAPARVEVIGPELIAERPAVQPTEHLRGVAGVDIVTQGLQSTNVVARGFNNVFSGALLALTDHRIAAIPSLRVNALYMVPATNEDIERMEVVLGPGSALYGPNTANGVLHMFTRSPLTYQGNTISLTGGERSVFQGTGRTSHLITDNIGVKLSGQYFRGDEWEYIDPVEQSAREEALPSNPNTLIGSRMFDTERWGVDGRVDWRITDNSTAILSAGRSTTVQGVELTGLGAAQVQDWTYDYFQGRFNSGGLFAQAYLNTSSAGDTYLLRDAASIVDDSKFFVAQVQHAVSPRNWQDFTYGIDYLRTMPETGGTIHGIFEDEDEFTEIGAFLQSETTFANRFDLVMTGRVDRHSVVDETVFSPRAALVFRPDQTQTFRVSYNRAYSNPGSVQLFLDLGAGPVPGPLGALGYNIRARGTGTSGLTFQTESGDYVMRSPFGGNPSEMQAITVANLWQMQVQGLAGALRQQGIFTEQQASQFVGFMLSEQPSATISTLNPITEGVGDFVGPADVPGIRESNVTTYEVGYKGLLGERLLLAADVWYAQRDNFISALVPQSSFVLLNPQQVIDHSTPRIQGFLMAGGMSPAQAQATAQVIAGRLAQLPGGVVASPDVTAGGADLLVSYRNYGDVDLWGGDVSATALFGPWTVGLSASLVSDDYFRTEGEIVTLNAPERKGSATIGYRNRNLGFNAEGRVRYFSGFPVNSGVFVGIQCIEAANPVQCVESNTLADLTVGYDVPQLPGATLQLTVQNVFDSDYQSFIGVPEVGRLALLRLRYDF
ncbi:MAG: TonB-dependent receptor [Gemmatimonadota bacterium]